MIVGIGTDIVAITRIERALLRHKQTFAARILSATEYSLFGSKSNGAAAWLAKRFAAKEAVAKAFGTGFRNGLSLQHITIINNSYGQPQLQFDGVAAELEKQLGVTNSHLSLADERDYAIAYVVLESNRV